MYILVLGRSASPQKEQKLLLVSINYEGALRLLDDHNLVDMVGDVNPELVFVDQADPKVNDYSRIVVQSAHN